MTDVINPIDAHVGGQVRRARETAGVTQAALADRLGVTPRQVEFYESGAGRIRASKLFEIAALLRRPVSIFYEGLTQEGDEVVDRRDPATAAFASAVLAARISRLPPGRRRLVEVLVNSLAS